MQRPDLNFTHLASTVVETLELAPKPECLVEAAE